MLTLLLLIMSDKEEKNILQRLRSGDNEAYEEIYHRYHKRMYGFAFKYLKSHELAEDAVHDTFIKLWENRETIQSNIKGFLFTSVRNHVMNMMRNKKRKVLKHIQIELQRKKSSNKTEEVIIYSEYRQILARGLDELPEGKREIFNLKTDRNLSNREIAQQLDITVHTVKSQYYEASKFIRDYLDKHAGIQMRARGNG